MHLVLLPGMIGTAELFAPLLREIPSDVSTQVIAYPPDQSLSMNELLQLIEAEIHEKTDLVIVGESFSAELAAAFAARHPDQMRALVLSGGYVRPPWPSWMRWLIHPFMVRIPLPSTLIRFFATGSSANEPFVDWVRNAFRAPDAEVMTHRARQALSLDFTDQLKQCRVPILYLAPDRDRLVPPWNLKWIVKNRPDVFVEKIPGPHLILQTAPRECWVAIERFVHQTENVTAVA